MRIPEFKTMAKVRINKTIMDWKNADHAAEGTISLLGPNDEVIQTFPFKVNLNDGEALKAFSDLVAQEQTMEVLASEAPVDEDAEMKSKISNAVSGLKPSNKPKTKSSSETPWSTDQLNELRDAFSKLKGMRTKDKNDSPF
ncbi:MAG TPA: hypothetical protein VFM18_18490 [Methanosarcina sp.]|nr:hypothetical protein [Methanosarcina sp.]